MTWYRFRTILFYSFDLGNNTIFKKIFFLAIYQNTKIWMPSLFWMKVCTYLHMNTVLIFSKYLLLNIFDSTINLPKYRLIRLIYKKKKKNYLIDLESKSEVHYLPTKVSANTYKMFYLIESESKLLLVRTTWCIFGMTV